MKNHFLLWLLIAGICIPMSVGVVSASPDGWVLNSKVSQSEWIKNAAWSTTEEKCAKVLDRTSCDYTGPTKALRLGYEYEFADEFWAWDRDRQMWASCTRFDEDGDYNQRESNDWSIVPWVNPTFPWTSELINNNYWVNKNKSMVVLNADKIYEINAVPQTRSSNNLMVKYVIEYSNDQNWDTRYQHTECYPYEISRCGDGVVDKDWFKKAANDPGEECDYNDPNRTWWKDGSGKTCNQACKLVDITPECNNTYNGKIEYTSSSNQWLKSTDNLCKEGSVIEFTYSGTPRTYIWKCQNGKTNVPCSATQIRCGDGEVQSTYEECDPAAPEWKDGKDWQSCNSSCKIEYQASSCGDLDWNTAYNANYSTPRITENTSGLCGVGKLVAWTFSYDKPTWKYTWDCKNGDAKPASCNAQDLWCGDGTVQSAYEECDPESAEWKNRTDWQSCNVSCKINYETPLCSSDYNNKKAYQKPENPYLKGTEILCNPWSVKGFSQWWTPLKFTWGCENWNKSTDSKACELNQYRCGDGEVNWWWDWSNFIDWAHYEECDPESAEWKDRTDWQTCSASCKIEYEASSCGDLDWNTAYNANYSSPRITESTSGLCGVGKLVAWTFSYDKPTWKYTWDCKNGDAKPVSCNAQDLWCGDGTVQSAYETCDPEDTRSPSVKWWWEGTWKMCNGSCKIEDVPRTGPVCSSSYNGIIKYTETSAEWLNSSYSLCDKWSLVSWSFSWSWTPRTFTWSCTNDWINTGCVAYQQWCGDGVKNGNEVCDPEDITNKVWWWDWCSNTCEATYNPWICGSTYHTKKTYLPITQNRITENTQWLCDKWTVINFNKHPSSYVYTWQCINGWKPSDTCRADQEWCGDGTVQSAYETCDPEDTRSPSVKWWGEWTWKTCNSSCKLEDISRTEPICSSSYNNKTQHTETSTPWLSANDKLCDIWSLIPWSFSWSWTPRTFTWSCTNDWLDASCVAYQQWCWDGVKNGNEACDDWSKNGTSSSTCSATCTKVAGVSCGTNDKWTKYFPTKQTSPWFTKTSDWMCAAGLTVWLPSITWTDSHLEWTCSNANGALVTCKAYQEYCWDGIKNGTEECDWTDGCDSLCNKIPQSNGCDQTFQWYLRLWNNEPFTDSFDAWWHDRYLFDYDVLFQENYGDHNNGANPTFSWTSRIINKWKKVGEYESGVVIESTPYHIVSAPTRRAQNNVYIEYTIWYDNVAHSTTPSRSNLYSHKECASYEISRCGDGILDTDYNEECDPGSEWTKVMPDWRICNSECKLVTVPDPICNSDYDGKRLLSLVEGDYLCKQWTVSNFDYNETTYTWTWRCNNVAWKHVDCSAKKPYCGDGILDAWETCDPADQNHTNWWNDGCSLTCEPKYLSWEPEIEKTLQQKVPVDHTWQVLKWTIKVTAKWWNVTDFEIQDKLPEALTYSGYRVVSNADNLTVTWPTWPVKSWSNNIYTWNVKWTLKENHVLTLEVETVVNKMPKSEDDYLNIACVIDDGKIDCDEDEPPVKDGTPEIEKTLKDRVPVEKTGQVLKWTVKVTAKWWNVTDFEIQDKLPEALTYSGYRVVSNNDNLTVTWPTWPVKSWSNNIYTWNVKWTLKENHVLTLEVETVVNKMPKSEDDYLNIACVIDDGKIDCDEDEPPVKWGKLNIVKTIEWSKEIKNTGDIVTWNIKVTALDWNVTDFTITDEMPSILWYSGSLVLHNPWLTVWTPIVSWNEVSWRVTWTLEKWEYIEIQLNTYAKVMPDKDYKNVACVKYVDEDWKETEKCDDEPLPAPHLRIKKAFRDWSKEKEVHIWDTIAYKVDFGNTGNASATITSLKDFLPKNVWYISSEIFVNWEKIHTNATQKWDMDLSKWFKVVDGVYIDIYDWITLKPGDSWYIILTWKILGEYTGNRQNFACIYLNDEKIDCDDAVHTIGTGEVMCKSNIEKTKSENLCSEKSWTVPVTCSSEGWNADTIELFCDGKSIKSEHNTSELKWDCVFSSDWNHTVKCEVNWSTKSANNCEWTYTLSHHSCSSWGWPSGWWGTPTPYCEKRPNDPICIFASPSCFNVNEWNVSVETWEYLPFYLNIERDNSNDYEYKVYKGWDFDDFENDSNCTSWTVALNSMECTYVIRDVYNRIVFKETRNCLMDGTVDYNDNLINAWINRQNETYDVKMQSLYDGTYTYKAWISFTKPSEWRVGSTDAYNPNGPKITDFWEYKFQIEQIKFYQCKDWEWKRATSAWPVCQSNFVLTRPYTVQKTPSWNLTASTETLKHFKEADGSDVKLFSDYVSNITPSTYNENNVVEAAMKKFRDKYSKLAVQVDIKNNKFLDGSNVTVSKVPWKDIYFVDWNITIKWWPTIITKPFTIVQMNWSTTIEGDVKHNMMLLTDKNITFSWSCTSSQTVKWIFYAWWNLLRLWVWKNDDLKNNLWCDEWWLYVKWVLIWHGFEDLMNGSRSHIENRWQAWDRAKKVMDWASVVIEYSPSVFTKSTMPPGAEDFTTALSIYKQ